MSSGAKSSTAASRHGWLTWPARASVQQVFTGLLLFRLVNAFCVRTFFQPDEFFQALEPAWNIAFGADSGAWLTWEWQHQLRSSLHPAMFAGGYVFAENVASVLGMSPQLEATILVAMPKVIQAVLAALGDLYTWQLAAKVYGDGNIESVVTLWMTALNPWQWYCSTRTFSNSLETTLTAMALQHWHWEVLGGSREKTQGTGQAHGEANNQSLGLSLLLAAIAVILRPTNLLIWLAILTLVLTRMTLDGASNLNMSTVSRLFGSIITCGGLVLAVSVISDRFYFGFWTFPPYKWLHFNISHNLAVFYGVNDWHYYLSQGIPLLTTTLLPFALIGLYKATTATPDKTSVVTSNTLKTLSFAVMTMVGALSLISHKEVRFIYPLLPILHVLAAPSAASYFIIQGPSSQTTPKNRETKSASPTLTRKRILTILLAINLILASYLSLLHQPAPLTVLTYLRSEFERLHPTALTLRNHASPHPSTLSDPTTEVGTSPTELFALFLTPCHSTPWRSHLVYPALRARALTCEPPLDTAPGSRERREYIDEADRFYASTTAPDGTRSWGKGFLGKEIWPLLEDGYPRGGEVPRFIVGFEGIEEMLMGFFEEEGRDMGVKLRRVWEGWNGAFNEDWRRRGKLVVWDTGVYDPTIWDMGAYEDS